MKDFLLKILLKLKLVIDVLINKLNIQNSICSNNGECEDKIDSYKKDIITDINYSLKKVYYEEDNWNMIVLEYYEEDKKYIENTENEMILLDEYIESNNIYIEEKYNENYSRVDIKALCKDSTIKDIEKIYLIKLIANINLENNGVKISISDLETLLNNKNRNQINKKLADLQVAGAIRIVPNSKGNRYYILKHVKDSIYKNQYNCESIKNDTSITSDTSKCKEIEKKKVNDEIINLLNNNIKYCRKGLSWNQKYLRKMALEKNNME